MGVKEEDGSATCYLFDLIAVSPTEQPEMVAVLAALLQEEAVQKVVHDGRRDAEALLYQLGISLVNVLDTQVRSACGRNSSEFFFATFTMSMPWHHIAISLNWLAGCHLIHNSACIKSAHCVSIIMCIDLAY